MRGLWSTLAPPRPHWPARWRHEVEEDYEPEHLLGAPEPPEPDDRPIEHYSCSECPGCVVDGECQRCGMHF